MPPEFHTHVLDLPASAAGLRLDQALALALPQYSRSRIQRWIREGAVSFAGRAALPRERVRGGEQVSVRAEFIAETGVQAQALPLNIIYADDAVLVIDKPVGLVVHPGAGNREHTLQNALLAYDESLAQVPRAGLVHRLDKDTSGLMVIARTPLSHTRLVATLAARDIHREYLAVVHGVPTGGGRIDQPIGRHRTQRTRMTVRADGRAAVTHYWIQERFRVHTLLRLQLETGRTHQIRVHLAHLQLPIVGDPVYGGRRRQAASTGDAQEATAALNDTLRHFARQALHARRLEFAHPLTGRALSFEAQVPEDFAALLGVLRLDRDAHA